MLEHSFRSITKQEPDQVTFQDYQFTTHLPPKPINWLKSFGITDEEIELYGLLYEPNKHYLSFPVYNNGEMVFVSSRYFGDNPDHPKYITKGSKDTLPIFTLVPEGSTVIIVEDPVSAMKVGRVYSAVPVFGSHVDSNLLIRLSGRFDSIGVWLDPDMHRKSFLAVSRGAMLINKPVFTVRSTRDPKFYVSHAIQHIVETCKGTV